MIKSWVTNPKTPAQRTVFYFLHGTNKIKWMATNYGKRLINDISMGMGINHNHIEFENHNPLIPYRFRVLTPNSKAELTIYWFMFGRKYNFPAHINCRCASVILDDVA